MTWYIKAFSPNTHAAPEHPPGGWRRYIFMELAEGGLGAEGAHVVLDIVIKSGKLGFWNKDVFL